MRKQTAIWVTKDKQRIRICDMTNSHLLNTIAMLERSAAKFLATEISSAYSVLCSLQGEMAQFCCEQDIRSLEETDASDWLYEHSAVYPKLLLEKERRKL